MKTFKLIRDKPVYSNTLRPITPKVNKPNTKKIYSTPDPDPVVKCNMSPQCGGGQKALRQSVCLNSVCCGFMDGSWKLAIKKDFLAAQEVERKAVESKRRNDLKAYQDAMKNLNTALQSSINAMQAISTQNKIDTQNSINQIQQIHPTINDIQPTPISSGKKCYSTWDEYFKAHRGGPAYIAGLGPVPPCD